MGPDEEDFNFIKVRCRVYGGTNVFDCSCPKEILFKPEKGQTLREAYCLWRERYHVLFAEVTTDLGKVAGVYAKPSRETAIDNAKRNRGGQNKLDRQKEKQTNLFEQLMGKVTDANKYNDENQD